MLAVEWGKVLAVRLDVVLALWLAGRSDEELAEGLDVKLDV